MPIDFVGVNQQMMNIGSKISCFLIDVSSKLFFTVLCSTDSKFAIGLSWGIRGDM